MKASYLKKVVDEIKIYSQATIMLRNGQEIELEPKFDYGEGYQYIVNEEDNVFEAQTMEASFLIDCDDIAMIKF